MECYYFGTFNPVHTGHTKLAEEVVNKFGFDKIVFVPAYLPPHKNFADNPIHRLNMLKLVKNDKFDVNDIEYKLKGTSYSFRTIQKLLKKGEKMNFLIGFDAFKDIESWKNSEFLKENLNFIVLKREGENREEIEKLKDKGFKFVICDNIETIDISSSAIRDNIKRGLPITGLVDKNVKRYIYEHGLYGENT